MGGIRWTFGASSNPNAGDEENIDAYVQDIRMYNRAPDTSSIKDTMGNVAELFDGKGQFGLGTRCNADGSDSPLMTGRNSEGTKLVDATYDSETREAKIYINGKLVVSEKKTFAMRSGGYLSLMSGSHNANGQDGGSVCGAQLSNVAVFETTRMPDERLIPEVTIGTSVCRYTSRVPSPMSWLSSSPLWTKAFEKRCFSSQLSETGCEGPVTHLFDGGSCAWVSEKSPSQRRMDRVRHEAERDRFEDQRPATRAARRRARNFRPRALSTDRGRPC